ncbi:MAG: hypothetical protein Q4C77_15600 [Eubacteriales bacterium]|nr:hypothetical protein [Eubacteriales bacterium]
MPFTTISFLSSRNRGISPDLKLIEHNLGRRVEDVSLRYYVNSELISNRMLKEGRKKAKEQFCQKSSPFICIDSSLPAGFEKMAGDEKRILVATPFDYQFKNMLALENDSAFSVKTFRCFSHILATSPFTSELLKNAYELEGTQVIDNICAPVAWDINQSEKQVQIRDMFEFYYPNMKGKKVISVLTVGEIARDYRTLFENFDLEKFLNHLGEDWFLLTNNWFFLERAAVLAPEYIRSFGYISEVLPSWNTLYFTDMMITNDCTFVSWYASRRKPVYYLAYSKKTSENYMKKHYPDLYLEMPDKLYELRLTDTTETEEHKRFCEHFSYFPASDPCEVVRELIVGNS